jgi:type I restriction enzyme S subunit
MPSSVIDGIPYIMTGDFFGINGIDFESAKKVSIEDYEQLAKKIKPEFGDIVIARYASVGAVRYIETKSKFLVSYSCAIVKCNRYEDSKYLYYILQSDVIQSKIGLEVNASSQKNIGIDSIKKLNIFLPTLPEQQKIAKCLNSLDELIAAQARKVDKLKTHKRGLMQQLFPREGETQPRLRFPEFQNSPDWERSSLGNIFETTSGGTPSRSETDYWDGNVPWITTSLVNSGVITEAVEFISKEGLKNSSAKLFPKGTVLIAMYGQGKTRGQVALLGIEAATNQACAAVLPTKGIEPYFVFLNLAGRYEEFRNLSNSGGQENLSQGLIREIPFAYPLDYKEQRRIVDCLFSLDEAILAQTDKLETIKTQKKGLMQQLFPSADAIEA